MPDIHSMHANSHFQETQYMLTAITPSQAIQIKHKHEKWNTNIT